MKKILNKSLALLDKEKKQKISLVVMVNRLTTWVSIKTMKHTYSFSPKIWKQDFPSFTYTTRHPTKP